MDLCDAEYVGGKLRVAVCPTLAAALVPSVIQSIAVDCPYIDVLIEEMNLLTDWQHWAHGVPALHLPTMQFTIQL
jgi:hypothetical protein